MSKKLVPSDEQLESVVKYIQKGSKNPDVFALGFELEHFVVNDSGYGVSYFKNSQFEVGIGDLLQELAVNYDKIILDTSDKHIFGLRRNNTEITLEPGGQLEISIGPFRDVSQILKQYNRFRNEIDPILAKYGYHLETHDYRLKDKADDICLIPKERYIIMDEYLSKTGNFGKNMMRCSAATQISIDFENEDDAIAKLRLAFSKTDYFAEKYSNSPIFECQKSPYKLLRKTMWHDLDKSRTGEIPGVFEKGFSFEKYAYTLLTSPLMVVNYTKTPEYFNGEIGGEIWQIAQNKSACQLYPQRELNSYEIEHIISTFFFDVRLKNFIELRMVDSLSIERALEFAGEVKDLFYG